MNIVIIGAGAMGSIYGGRLSQHNQVCLIDTNEAIVRQIRKDIAAACHFDHAGHIVTALAHSGLFIVISFKRISAYK